MKKHPAITRSLVLSNALAAVIGSSSAHTPSPTFDVPAR